MRSKPVRTSLIVFLFYIVSALIMTYPLVLHLFSDIAGSWGTRDSLGNVAEINWVKRAIFDLHVDFRNFNWILHPYGMDIVKEMSFSINFLLAVPLALFVGPIFAYNFMFLLDLSLSAFTMYLFAGRMTGNRLAALFSGFAFGFSSYHFARAFAGHFNLFGTWWIPLMLLFLHRAIEEKRARDSALAAIFFVLASFTNGYYGAMCLALVLCIALFYAITVVRRDGWAIGIDITDAKIDQTLRVSIPFLLFSLPLIAYLDYIGPPGQPFHMRILAEYSASPFDYLTLGFLHPIWQFLGAQPLGHGFPWERDLYLGISTLVLAYLGLTRSRKRVRWLYLFVALLFFTLSLGPMLWMDDSLTSIQLPYRILYEYVPLSREMRAVARFGLIAMLAISLLAAIGLASILEKRMGELGRRKTLRHSGGIIATLLIMMVALEFASVPFPHIQVSDIEGMQAYRWLADQPGDFAIAEYPIDWANDKRAMFGTMVHGKRTVSGSVDFPKTEVVEMVDRLSFFQPDFSRKVDLDLYHSLNIRYVLFHSGSYVGRFGLSNWYRAIDIANRTDGLKLVGGFEGTLIYEVL